MADNKNILAGSQAGGTGGLSLAYFAPSGTALPTNATTALAVAYKDAGICDQKGLTIKTNTTSVDIKGFGSTQIQRTIISEQKRTVDVTFLETNAISVAVYNSLDLAAITVSSTDGSFTVATGLPAVTRYVAVFETIDGLNKGRFVLPNCQVSNQGDLNVSMSAAIDRPITLTAYPDTTGKSVYEYYIVDNLKT